MLSPPSSHPPTTPANPPYWFFSMLLVLFYDPLNLSRVVFVSMGLYWSMEPGRLTCEHTSADKDSPPEWFSSQQLSRKEWAFLSSFPTLTIYGSALAQDPKAAWQQVNMTGIAAHARQQCAALPSSDSYTHSIPFSVVVRASQGLICLRLNIHCPFVNSQESFAFTSVHCKEKFL